MALGRQGERQTDLMVGWAELPRSPGHAFYDRLQAVLIEAGFDGFAEQQCARPLRRQAGPAVAAAGPLLPDASGRLLRGDRQRARPGMALRRQPVAARVPAAGHDRAGARPFLAEQDALAAAAGGARGGLRLGAAAPGRARPDPGRPDRRRRLDDGGQRGAARDRPPRQRRRLPRDAQAAGQGERDRDADGGRPDPAGSQRDRASGCPTRTGPRRATRRRRSPS